MIVIRDFYENIPRVWAAPDMTLGEAVRTVAYWSQLGLTCEVADVDPRDLGFSLEDDE